MRHYVRSSRVLLPLAACALLFAVAQAGFAATYNVVDLGALGGTSSGALGINGSGQIVGYAVTSNNQHHAAFWASSGSSPVDLGTLGGTFSEAFGINDSGQIVGDATTIGGTHDNAAAWTNTSSPGIDLGPLGGVDGAAEAINVSGQFAGYTTLSNGHYQATFWTNATSSAINLSSLGGTDGQAFGINGAGQIVGDANTVSNKSHAAFWANSGSTPVDLGTLGGSFSDAFGINALGQIVGDAYTAGDTAFHAALWTKVNGSAVDLGTLGGTYSGALGINSSGLIVGYAYLTNNTAFHAVVWTNDSSSAIIDLNGVIPTNTGWVLQQANAINDSGEIVGFGTLGGQTHAFALVPTAPLISAPSYVSVWITSTNIALAFPSLSNAFYDVQSRTDLISGSWSTIASNITGTGGVMTIIDIGGATIPNRFYRVGAHSEPSDMLDLRAGEGAHAQPVEKR